MIPSKLAIRAFVPWSEWPASTDSQNEASDSDERVFIEMRDSSGEANERCGSGGVQNGEQERRAQKFPERGVCRAADKNARISSRYSKRCQTPGKTHLESTLTADGDKEGALVPLGPFRVDGQVGAAHDADDDLTVLDQAEADGVLPAAEEALGPIDRVERPVPALRTAVRVTPIDQLEPFLLAPLIFFDFLPRSFFLRERQRFRHGFAGEADNLRLDGGLFWFLEVGRVFLADDLVLREVGEQQRRDERLGGVVADCGVFPTFGGESASGILILLR